MQQQLIFYLIELRKRLIYVLIGFVVVFLCLFHFANPLYTYLAKPVFSYLPADSRLIATDITAPFFVPLKLAAFVAFIIALPNTIYQIWQFIAPAMYKYERKVLLLGIISSIILFVLGMLFCYFIVLTLVCKFIAHFKASEISMFTDISKYLNFIINLFLVFGCAFETPVIVYILVRCNFVSYAKLASLRRYILVGSFVIAAILAPPDVLSQTLLALPIYVLYELGLFIVRTQANGS